MAKKNTKESESRFTKDEHDAVLELLVSQARVDLLSFLHFMWPQVEGQLYSLGLLHTHLADIAQNCWEGNIGKYQVVSVPPQHGKSRMLSVRVAAWLVGAQPGINIALTGFSHSLLTEFIDEARRIMVSPRYQLVFPDLRPVKGRDRAGDVLFTNNSNIQARSAGSKLTGRRVDWLIIDDPHSGRAEAESPSQRRKINQWFHADCLTRMSADGKIFIIATRWHPDDLIGGLTSEEGQRKLIDAGHEELLFQQTNLAAIAEDGDVLGRKPGQALFPEQRPLKFLEGVKAMMPSYEWESQYMGRPQTASGDQCDISNIVFITKDEVPRDVEWVRGWDLAITEGQQADFTAGVLCARDKNGRFYIINSKRGQKAWAQMRNMIITQSLIDRDNDRVFRIGVEGVSGFDAVYSDVKQELLGQVSVVKKNPPRGGKLLRAQPWLNLIEAGKVCVVRGDWNKDFLNELELFPEARHDDQVDAVSIAWEMLVMRDVLLIA